MGGTGTRLVLYVILRVPSLNQFNGNDDESEASSTCCRRTDLLLLDSPVTDDHEPEAPSLMDL